MKNILGQIVVGLIGFCLGSIMSLDIGYKKGVNNCRKVAESIFKEMVSELSCNCRKELNEILDKIRTIKR